MTNYVSLRVPNRGTCRILRDEKGVRGRIRRQKRGGVRVETGAEKKNFSRPDGMRLVAKDASETPYVCVSRPPFVLPNPPTRRSGIAMTQNDSPNPTDIGGETLAPENVNALVHVSPKPDVTTGPRPEPKAEAAAPDPFAVGVRVLRMAPAWLLSVTAGCSVLIILLGWMNPGGMASTVAYAPALNDARPAQAVPAPTAAQPAAPAQPAQATVPAAVPSNAAPAPESVMASAPAPESVPAPAVEQAAPAAPAKEQTPAPTAPERPQAEVKEKAETPAKSSSAAGNFTVQVGSFNNSSEANERVSSLRNAGFEARAVAVELPGRGRWYRVQVGRFADRDEASKAVASLRAKGAAAAIVVPVQN